MCGPDGYTSGNGSPSTSSLSVTAQRVADAKSRIAARNVNYYRDNLSKLLRANMQDQQIVDSGGVSSN